MTQDGLDPRRDRLVAALYGELNADEMKELDALLAEDPALRAEMRELREARNWLREWEPADAPPSFTVVAEAPRPRGRRFSAALAAWAFGGTAFALAALMLAGLRVDWLDRGMTVRFGDEATPLTAARAERLESLTPVESPPVSEPRSLPSASADAVPAAGSAPPAGVPVAPAMQTPPLTREDLDAYTAELAQIFGALVADVKASQRAEMAGAFERFYDVLRVERRRDLDALRTEVHGVGLGLMAEQTRTNARLIRLLDNGTPDGVPAAATPADDAPRNQEEDKNDE